MCRRFACRLPVLRTRRRNRRCYAFRTQGERAAQDLTISFAGAGIDTKTPPKVITPKTQQQHSQVEIKVTQPRVAGSPQERSLVVPASCETTRLQRRIRENGQGRSDSYRSPPTASCLRHAGVDIDVIGLSGVIPRFHREVYSVDRSLGECVITGKAGFDTRAKRERNASVGIAREST